ncbi:MAG: class I SAM-dependent methyltransferase [Planctomycetaceae bacterium]|nr:class I SAM-dependent methyltransferase [Planctomycetaceae bacterium]
MHNPSESSAEGFLRNSSETEAARRLAELFESSPDSTQQKLAHFAKYARRQDLTRLLVRYELFKRVLDVKGSIVECGVFRGSGLMTWANLSAILEPNNIMRRIYGFDTFEGFPDVDAKDASHFRNPGRGDLRSGCFDELQQIIAAFDQNRFLGHVAKVQLVKGDAARTIPEFVEANPHLVVSLLFLDFDLYEPTMAAIKAFVPRMPQGAILAFDELDNPAWPGETLAYLEGIGTARHQLKRFEFDPYIGYVVL